MMKELAMVVISLTLAFWFACGVGFTQTQDTSSKKPVRLLENVADDSAGGLECFQVVIPSATYLLEKSGGGLSSILDRDGVDWIGFHPQPGSGAGGEYRGFPNAVHQQAGSYFHPKNAGTDPCRTRVVSVQGDHVTISVESSNRLWAGRYDFFPSHCTFTMTQMPPDKKYWVLYEGIPGGQYHDADWWMTSDVNRRVPLTTPHDGDIRDPEWIVFGDVEDSNRVVFLLHHEDDSHPDRFYPMQQKMTVFGFGRKGIEKFLNHIPQSVSIGFLETTDHTEIGQALKRLAESSVSTLPAETNPQIQRARLEKKL